MSQLENCIFCRIVSGDVPCVRLCEDARTLAFMDINPGNPGHALVIPKAHAPDLYAAPPESLHAVVSTAQRVAAAIRAALAPDGVSLMQANGPGAGQSVFHLHVHVIPRREGDRLTYNGPYPQGEADAIERTAARIREHL